MALKGVTKRTEQHSYRYIFTRTKDGYKNIGR